MPRRRNFANVLANQTSPCQGVRMDETITTAEAAKILGCTVATVNRHIIVGKLIPARKLPGKTGAYLFNRADVDQFAAQRRAS